MVFLRYLFLIILLPLLFLLEVSLFSHFKIYGASLHLVLIGVVLINFLSQKKNGFPAGLFRSKSVQSSSFPGPLPFEMVSKAGDTSGPI